MLQATNLVGEKWKIIQMEDLDKENLSALFTKFLCESLMDF